jgi:hypothetical protein
MVLHSDSIHLTALNASLTGGANLCVNYGVVAGMGDGRGVVIFVDVQQGFAAAAATVADEDFPVLVIGRMVDQPALLSL